MNAPQRAAEAPGIAPHPEAESDPAPSRARLDPAARREFEDMLGKRHVSDDPAILASYAWTTGSPSLQQLSRLRPVAVTLPDSTVQVQAIVKACLRHGLKFRAHSTGMAGFHLVGQDGVVAIDLRRMDRLVEIDARNQMAVVEPYVTAQQLLAEAMKVGLTTHVIGAGWTHSPLASATSLGGIGITGNHTGQNVRNLMAWEWVTPEGDILRAGSAGAGSGWFAGEGPGPGFRGMIRGQAGAAGGLGVFTRIGYKLHPWAGPRALEHRGAHPQLGIALTETMRLYQIVWTDWNGPKEAAYEFMISNAATFLVRIPPDHIGVTLYPTNRDYYDSLMAGSLPGVALNENRISWTVLAVSESLAEAEWREKVIDGIIARTGGRRLEVAPEHVEILARNAITSCYSPRCYRMAPRQLTTSFGVYDSFSHLPAVIATGERLMKPYKEDRKTLCEGVPEAFWIWPSEGRHLWTENIVNNDNDSARSAGDAYAFVLQTIDENDRNPRGISGFALGGQIAELYGTHFGLNRWMAKVKALLDPHGAADGIYPTGATSVTTRLWPVLRTIFFRFPSVLRFAMFMQIRNNKSGSRIK